MKHLYGGCFKSLSGNSNTWSIAMLASVDCFLIQVVAFLVLVMVSDFQLYPAQFVYYAATPDPTWIYYFSRQWPAQLRAEALAYFWGCGSHANLFLWPPALPLLLLPERTPWGTGVNWRCRASQLRKLFWAPELVGFLLSSSWCRPGREVPTWSTFCHWAWIKECWVK